MYIFYLFNYLFILYLLNQNFIQLFNYYLLLLLKREKKKKGEMEMENTYESSLSK